MQKILVWDWPVRLGHWLMVGGFILAWLTSESETFRLVHALSGATVLAVATFRLPWGFIGSRYARFVDFVRGPGAVKDYAVSLLKLEPAHHVGHNPAGGWAIMLLLIAAGVLFAFYAGTGQVKYKRAGLVTLKWTIIAALGFFGVLSQLP